MSVCVRQKSGNGYDRSSVVVVAVKAAKEVSRTALTWALTNVVKPGDCVRLLVVIPTHASSKKLWGFPHFHNDCATGYWRFMSGTMLEQKEYFTDICNQIMCQLHHIYDAERVSRLSGALFLWMVAVPEALGICLQRIPEELSTQGYLDRLASVELPDL